MASLRFNGLAHPGCAQHSGDSSPLPLNWRPVAGLATHPSPPSPPHPLLSKEKPGSFQSLFNVEDKHFIREDKLPELGARDLLSFHPDLKFFLQILITFPQPP